MAPICSCGFILIDTRTGHWLLGHPPNKAAWDFPKGWAMDGESHLAAAVRELREETGIILPEAAIQASVDFGRHPFSAEKDLHLFLTTMPLDVSKMFCMSFFTAPGGMELPEVDDYRLVPPADLSKYLSPRKQRYLAEHVLPFLPANPFIEGVAGA